MDQEYSKYEVLKTRKSKELVFLIKKIYWQKFAVENGKFCVLDAGLKIYFSEFSKGTNKYNKVPWSIKCERSFIKGIDDKVKYAYFGVLQVDEEYRDNGLGSYLLDSLTQWAQDNFNESIVDIQIVGEGYTDSSESLIKHFYSKRNISSGVKVSEVNTFLEESQKSGKIEVISVENYLLELFENNLKLEGENAGLGKGKGELKYELYRLEKRIERDQLLIAFLTLVVLTLGWFLGSK